MPPQDDWPVGKAYRAWVTSLEKVDRALEDAEVAAIALDSRDWLASMATALFEQKREILAVRRELGLLRERLGELEQERGHAKRRPSPSYRVTHADEFLAHAGRYVAWGEQGILASAESYQGVLEQLSALGHPSGMGIEYIPKGPRIRR